LDGLSTFSFPIARAGSTFTSDSCAPGYQKRWSRQNYRGTTRRKSLGFRVRSATL